MSFLSPVNQARWARFRHNRRGYLSLWLFMLLFLCSTGAELIANDRPLLVQYRGSLYVPALKNYSETTFGGPFATAADYQIRGCKSSWMITAGYCGRRSDLVPPLSTSPPRRPSLPSLDEKLAGYRCQRRRCAGSYFIRHANIDSVRPAADLFSSVLGVLAGAIQGYYGGKIDLWGQRFIEVWSGMPTLFLIILLSRRPAGLLVAAGHYGTVRLDGAGRRRAGGIPAHP